MAKPIKEAPILIGKEVELFFASRLFALFLTENVYTFILTIRR